MARPIGYKLDESMKEMDASFTKTFPSQNPASPNELSDNIAMPDFDGSRESCDPKGIESREPPDPEGNENREPHGSSDENILISRSRSRSRSRDRSR